jgi:hypothetical protein
MIHGVAVKKTSRQTKVFLLSLSLFSQNISIFRRMFLLAKAGRLGIDTLPQNINKHV